MPSAATSAAARCDVLAAVVRPALAAAQHDVAVGVAARADDRHRAVVVDADEMVRMAGGDHGVERDAQAAVGAVLEADRHRQAARHLAMRLALGGARADRRPAQQIGDVLRHHRVEQLAGARQPSALMSSRIVRACVEAGGDVARAVQVRVVDQPLPADRRARLLEVGAHDDHELVARGVGDALEPRGVVARRGGVVDRARADDGDQPAPVAPVQDVADRAPRFQHHAAAAASVSGSSVFTARGETSCSAAARLRSSIGSVCCIAMLPFRKQKSPER